MLSEHPLECGDDYLYSPPFAVPYSRLPVSSVLLFLFRRPSLDVHVCAASQLLFHGLVPRLAVIAPAALSKARFEGHKRLDALLPARIHVFLGGICAVGKQAGTWHFFFPAACRTGKRRDSVCKHVWPLSRIVLPGLGKRLGCCLIQQILQYRRVAGSVVCDYGSQYHAGVRICQQVRLDISPAHHRLPLVAYPFSAVPLSESGGIGRRGYVPGCIMNVYGVAVNVNVKFLHSSAQRGIVRQVVPLNIIPAIPDSCLNGTPRAVLSAAVM